MANPLHLLRSLFSGATTTTEPVRVSASSIEDRHTLRTVNGSPSRTQLEALFAGGTNEFEFREARGDRYKFRLVKTGRVFRVDILASPSYGNRPADGHSTHRFNVTSSIPYICIKEGFQPREKANAAGIAIDWAKRTSAYIRDGNPWNS